MKPEVLLELLENAADQLGIRVSYEALQTSAAMAHGALCKVKGELRIIIDRRATAEERVVTIATALSRFDTTELELSEQVRDLLRQYAAGISSRRKTAA